MQCIILENLGCAEWWERQRLKLKGHNNLRITKGYSDSTCPLDPGA